MGNDRISDLVTAILKEDFIEYTQRMSKKYNIEMGDYIVKIFDFEKGKWCKKKILLPINPEIKERGMIFVPKKFLVSEINKSMKVFSQYLRENAKMVSKYGEVSYRETSKIIKIALNEEETLMKFHEETIKKYKSYNFDVDPCHCVKYDELGQSIAFQFITLNEKTEDYNYLEKRFVELLNNQEILTKNQSFYVRAFHIFLQYLVPHKISWLKYENSMNKYYLIFDGKKYYVNIITERMKKRIGKEVIVQKN